MTQAEITKFSEFSFYVTAQIDRINAALQDNNHTLIKIQQIHAHIKKQQSKILEVDNKVKLLEVYQSENFKNNQRIFNVQQTFDSVDKKITILEQMQSEIMSHAQEKMMIINEQTLQHMHSIQEKLKILENQVQKMRGRNVTLSKFRRDVSPTIVNCDSTKDISVDRKSNYSNNQIKKMEAKMHEYINQRLKNFEKKIHSALNADRQKLFDFQLPELENESFIKNRLTIEKTPSKNETNLNNTNRQKKQIVHQNNFRNTIQSYYNQATQKQDIRTKKTKKQEQKQQNYHLKSQKSHSRSKSKSKKKIKENSSKKSISLKTVNQYLRLTEKNK